MNNIKLRILNSIIIGAIAAIIFITVITVVADLYLSLKDWLKNIFYHHWVGKGILAAIIFFISGILNFISNKNADEEKIAKNLNILIWASIIGSLMISIFFILEALR